MAAVAALTLLVLSPALFVDIPAMTEYPNSLARIFVLIQNRTSDPHPFYATVWSPIPNLAFDLLVPPLAHFMSVEAAMKAMFLASEVLIVTGAMMLEYTVKGRHEISGFVALIVLYSTPFTFGLVNSEFALGLALWGMAAWIALRGAASPLRLVVHTVFVAGLFLSHGMALGVYGAMIGLYEAGCAWVERRYDRKTLAAFVILAIPAAAAWVVMKSAGTAVGSQIEWDFRTKAFGLASLNGYSITASMIEFLLLGVLILELRRHRSIKVLQPGSWVVLGLLALFVAMPARLFGSFFADWRVLTGLLLVTPAFLCIPDPAPRLRAVTVSALMAIAVSNTLIVAGVWRSYRGEYAAMLASFKSISPGSLVLVAEREAGDSVGTSENIFGHAPTLAVHYAQALVPSLFAIAGSQPIALRDSVRAYGLGHPGLYAPVPLWAFGAGASARLPSGLAEFASRWDREFNYLYVMGKPGPNPFPDRLTEITDSGHFTLYRIATRSVR